MFHEDGTFNFHNEIMTLAEEFCQEWEPRRGPFKNKMEGAYVLNFSLCTIRHDIEELLDQLEFRPIFKGVLPREVYERGGYGEENPKGLSNKDVLEIVKKALRRIRSN